MENDDDNPLGSSKGIKNRIYNYTKTKSEGLLWKNLNQPYGLTLKTRIWSP